MSIYVAIVVLKVNGAILAISKNLDSILAIAGAKVELNKVYRTTSRYEQVLRFILDWIERLRQQTPLLE